MKILISTLCVFFKAAELFSQNYHAVNGSPYAGSLGAGNNPGSIVNYKEAWDITLLSAQVKMSTNAVAVVNYSLLSRPSGSQYMISNGNFSRYAKSNFNLHLINGRVALGRNQAVAFGLNVRGYQSVQSSPYHFRDSAKSLRSFLKINEGNPVLNGNITTSTWIELFGTYGRTIMDNETGRFNAGITVKLMRGVSGAYAAIQNVGVARNMQGNSAVYLLKTVNGSYGYSSNLDRGESSKSTFQNAKDIFIGSQGGVSADIGLEYLVKTQAVTGYNDDESYYDYEWKISAAFLDIGKNNFRYGRHSRSANGVRPGMTHIVLEKKFTPLKSFGALNDSLATVVQNFKALSGKFSILTPMRFVVNIDKPLYNDFYLNAEVSANLSSVVGPAKLRADEMNLLTLTPRWETRKLGVFLPVQYNTKGQFWIGGAFKAGPLLLGVHNLGHIFAKNTLQDGGGYVALVIRSGSLTSTPRDRRHDCPQ